MPPDLRKKMKDLKSKLDQKKTQNYQEIEEKPQKMVSKHSKKRQKSVSSERLEEQTVFSGRNRKQNKQVLEYDDNDEDAYT